MLQWVAFAGAVLLAAYIRATSVPPITPSPAPPIPQQVVPQDDPTDRATAVVEQ
jgi:hypothetical protein